MSKVNFNDINFGATENTPTNSVAYKSAASDKPTVSFLSLKNDGDEAVVRFMVDKVEDFDIYNVHEAVPKGQKMPKYVNCLREAHESFDACPMCQAKVKFTRRVVVRMLQYTKAPDGSIKCEAKIWNRPLPFVQTLVSYLENYGPLSDIICKIIRHGQPHNTDTRYEVVPNLSKTIFRDDLYVKDTSLFDGFNALGYAILNKNADAMQNFIATGEFPAYVPKSEYFSQNQPNNQVAFGAVPASENVASTRPTTVPTAANSTPETFSRPQRVDDAPAAQPSVQAKESAPVQPEIPERPARFNTAPWETPATNNAPAASEEPERPRRFY